MSTPHEEPTKPNLCDMESLDPEMFKNKPWVSKLLKTCTDLTTKGVLHWCQTVIKIGEADIALEEYCTTVEQEVTELFEVLINEMNGIQGKMIDIITKLFAQIHNLSRNLHTEIPEVNFQSIPLAELRKILKNRADELQAEMELRCKDLRALQKKQLELGQCLGREAQLLPEEPLPNEKQLEELKLLIDQWESEKTDREYRFFEFKSEIQEVVGELGVSEQLLGYERRLLDTDDGEPLIKDTEMHELELFHKRLMRQKENVKQEILEVRHQIDNLWNKLELDIAERNAFVEKYTGISLQTLNALKEELKRCEILKKANIKIFIDRLRDQLETLWDKCHCSQSERDTFTYFNSDCYNEDLFELHEIEIRRYEQIYSENQELYELLEEHSKLWKDWVELDLNSGGANRYKNRGGRLLIEEKLRNKLVKRIPKIEEKVVRLAEAFKGRKGREFTTWGRSVEEYIAKLHEDKDMEFKIKLSAQKQKREQQQTSSIGKSRMNLFPPSSTMMSTRTTPRTPCKRKLITTPVTEQAKKLRATAQKKNAASAMPKLNISKSRRRSKSQRELRKRTRLSYSKTNSPKATKTSDESTSSAYNDFEKEMSTRAEWRSTAFVLKDKNQATPVRGIPSVGTPGRAGPSNQCNNFLTPRGISYLQKTPRLVVAKANKENF